MSNTPHTDKKLAYARFHLERLRAENAKMIGKDAVAIEADISACLGAIKSALYRLKREVGAETYEKTLACWKGTLTRVERHRWDRMAELRDVDVHKQDVQTSLNQKAIPASLIPGITVASPVEAMVPNPDPKGSPAFAPAWVCGHQVLLEAGDASETCERYLELAERLVKEFQKSGEMKRPERALEHARG